MTQSKRASMTFNNSGVLPPDVPVEFIIEALLNSPLGKAMLREARSALETEHPGATLVEKDIQMLALGKLAIAELGAHAGVNDLLKR